jgi:hypothetical protein
MKVLLCNDTATKSHIGCQAVSNAHARMLGRLGHKVERRYFVNELKTSSPDKFDEIVNELERNEEFLSAVSEVDAVIVNGEGTIHHGGGLVLLAALHVAKKQRKAALLVNCLFEDVDIDPAIVNAFDYFSVREARSYAYAVSRGLRCVQHFDSIVAADFSGGGQAVGHKLMVTDWTKSSDHLVGEISSRMLLPEVASRFDTQFFPVHCHEARSDWKHAVATLSEAKGVVTSRHHGCYLAILAGVPLIALKGNTWKGPGLLESFRTPLPLCTTFRDVEERLASLEGLKAAVERARDELLEAKELQHFSILGRGSDSTGEQEEVERLAQHVASRPQLLERDAEIIDKRRRKELRRIQADRPRPFWKKWLSRQRGRKQA